MKQESIIKLQIVKDQSPENTDITAYAINHSVFYLFTGKSDDGTAAVFTKYNNLENIGLMYEKK